MHVLMEKTFLGSRANSIPEDVVERGKVTTSTSGDKSQYWISQWRGERVGEYTASLQPLIA